MEEDKHIAKEKVTSIRDGEFNGRTYRDYKII